MTAAQMERIFEPFGQADSSITRRFGGTGLGLTISREMAEKLGGGISVQSQLGRGSVFTITIDPGDLAGVRMILPQPFGQSKSHQPVEEEPSQLPTGKILIVDDGESNRALVALFLKRAGVPYEMAFNGKMAVEMVNQSHYDAVLMDMQMPIMDGFEATRTLRAQGHRVPIIALTANAMAEDERNCREAGCTGFLPKPINSKLLLSRLAEAIDSTAAQSCGETQATPSVSRLAESVASGHDSIVSNLPMDDEDFVRIANLFHDQLRKKLDLMEQACQSQDFQQLCELGHWLKGAGGSAGFDDFNSPGKQLESSAHAQDLEQLEYQIQELRRMSDRIRIVPQTLVSA
jgi:CheY-like chemotaxis protein/HPt (histidine-containing phosphotransfer) domain-containing protein